MSAEIIKQFLGKTPSAIACVKRATYAYHMHHRESGAHYFAGSWREAPCRWCGQTREGVRWDWYSKPPICEARPKWANESIEGVVAGEERQFEKVFAKAKKLAQEINISNLNGVELARLHHTDGIDPTMLDCALLATGRSLPQLLHDEYQTAYTSHRATGKRGLIKEIIVAKTNE